MQATVQKTGGGWTVRHYVEQLLLGYEWKLILSIAGTMAAIIEGFYGGLLWAFLALFTLDFITGIMKSKRNNIPISSRRLRDSVTKLGAYMVLITALIITSKYEPTILPIVTVTYYYFIFTELKSIVENVEEMGVSLPTPLKDFIKQKTKEDEENGDKKS